MIKLRKKVGQENDKSRRNQNKYFSLNHQLYIHTGEYDKQIVNQFPKSLSNKLSKESGRFGDILISGVESIAKPSE